MLEMFLIGNTTSFHLGGFLKSFDLEMSYENCSEEQI